MRINKILSALLSVCVLASSCAFSAYAAEENEQNSDIAYAQLSSNGSKKQNISSISQGSSASETYISVTAADREGWQMKSSSPNIYIDIDDKFAHEVEDGTSFDLEIDYYNALTGFFLVKYDALNVEQKHAHYEYLNRQDKWKTVKITLDDAYFGGRCAGADIVLTTSTVGGRGAVVERSTAPVTIGAVRIVKHEKKNPLRLSVNIDESGNSFEWYKKEKKIVNSFTNLRDTDITAQVTCWGESREKVKCFETVNTITVKAGETTELPINVDSDRCDLYDYYVKIESDADNVHSLLQPTQFAILKTDENGYKNQDVYICAHPDQDHTNEEMETMADMINKSNVGGVRWAVLAGAVESKSGEDVVDNTYLGTWLNALRERNLKAMPILHGPNVTGFTYEMVANTPESLAKQKSEAVTLMKHAADIIDWYELYNETNHTFSEEKNERLGGVENYGKYVDAVADARDKYDPTAKVMGFATCDLGRETQKLFHDKTIDGGAYTNLDAYSSHPYSTSFTETGGAETLVFKWRDYIKERTGKELPIVSDEIGFTTADSMTNGDQRTHGNLMTRYDIYYKSIGLSEVCALYNFERKGSVDYDREDSFGLVESAFRHVTNARETKLCMPMEGYVAVTGHNYIFADTDFVKKLTDKDNLYINLFRSQKYNQDILTLNTAERKARKLVTVDLGTDNVEVYDDYGNMTPVTGHDGKFTFWVDERVTYVKGNFTKAELMEDNSAFLEISDSNVNSANNDVTGISYINNTDKEYDVEVVESETVKLYSGDKLAKGKSEVLLISNGELGTTSMVTINIKDGDKIVQSTQIFITIDKSVTADVGLSLISPENVDNWMMNLRLTNTSMLNVAKGTIEFTSPKEFKALGKISIGNIPRSCTSEYNIKLPKLVKKGMYDVSFDLNLNSGEKYSYSQKADMTIAKYAQTKPTIDGNIEPEVWKYNTWMYADKAEQLKENTGWAGPDDLSGRASIMWDEDNLYFAAVVTDNVFYQPYSGWDTWQADNIQIGVFYGEESYTISGQRSTTFHELSMAHTPLGDEVYRTLSQDNYYTAGKFENADICIVRKGNQTIYEAKIPWEGFLLPNQQPKENDKLGFSYMINESDGGARNGWIEYASGIGSAKDTTLFTWLTLLK
ncbi:MAG: sugar-binding protein [Clostridiales bacterium]|nr:sugar-binding protein [Clostridiales bacterium]